VQSDGAKICVQVEQRAWEEDFSDISPPDVVLGADLLVREDTVYRLTASASSAIHAQSLLPQCTPTPHHVCLHVRAELTCCHEMQLI